MATKPASPTAAPPSFYDNLPAGADAAAGGPNAGGGKKMSETDADIEKGLTGIINVLIKMGKLKKEWKSKFDKIKEDAKAMLVEIGGSPTPDEGGTPAATPAAAAPPAGGGQSAPPSQTDESHAA